MNKEHVSRTALISIFADIDKKISELHECSARDFKSLNIYLKDYYSKTSKISDNATTIFKMLSGEQGVMLRTNLELILNKITKSHTTINERINENLLMLEKILAKAIILTVSVKNFKQDLTTFKFMATNYKFISNYEQFSEKWNDTVSAWEDLVIELRKSLPAVEKRLDHLKSRLYQRISDLKANQRRSSASYSNLTKEIENCISLVSQKGKESDIQIPLLKQRTDNASQNIGNIITHLQYHDIIKQKIDHIQKSHSQIIDNLQSHGESKGNAEENLDSYYEKIGDVAGLQTSQLLLVNNEYQNAIEVIIKSFQQVGDDLTKISNISHRFSFDSKESDITLIRQIKHKLDEGILNLDPVSINDFTKDSDGLMERNDIIADIEKITEPLRKMSEKEITKMREEEGDGSQPHVLQQIVVFISDIKEKTEKFSVGLGEIFDLLKEDRSNEANTGWHDQMEREQIEIMVDISKMLDQLDNENLTLDNYLRENKQLCEEIISNIKGTIHKIDYYDFFEKVIEEVILVLNEITYKLKPRDVESDEKRAANLEELKANYTMKSERMVHKKVEANEDNPELIEISLDNEDEDDLELF